MAQLRRRPILGPVLDGRRGGPEASAGLTTGDRLRGFLLVHVGRDNDFALWTRLCVAYRPLGLDYLMHHAFAKPEPTGDVGRSHSHLAKPEDLLFFTLCESEYRLKHERRHCAQCTGTCAVGWNRRSKQAGTEHFDLADFKSKLRNRKITKCYLLHSAT